MFRDTPLYTLECIYGVLYICRHGHPPHEPTVHPFERSRHADRGRGSRMTATTKPPPLPIFAALAEPNRFAIVDLLRGGPRAVGDVATQLDIAQPHASRHLRVLADAGIVSARREAQSRIYRLERSAFVSVEDWLDDFAAVWEERADRLDTYLDFMAEDEESVSQRQEGLR